MSLYRQTVISSKSVEMSPYQQCDFAAQEELIEILPQGFKLDRLPCICDTYGPFEAYKPVQVPLWLALYLRGTNSCRVTPPRMLSVAALDELLKAELDSDATFQPIPDHFFSIARLLLRFAEDDVPDAPNVQRLVAEIEQTRKAKIINNIGFLDGNDFPPKALYFSSFTTPELQLLRTTLLPAINDGAELYDEAVRVPGNRVRHVGGVSSREDASTDFDTATSVSNMGTTTSHDETLRDRNRSGSYNFTDESSPTAFMSQETHAVSEMEGLHQSQTTATTSDIAPPTEARRRRTLRHR